MGVVAQDGRYARPCGTVETVAVSVGMSVGVGVSEGTDEGTDVDDDATDSRTVGEAAVTIRKMLAPLCKLKPE